MKKLLIALIIVLSAAKGFAQSAGNDTTKYIYYMFTYGNALDRYWPKKVLMLPADTTYSKDGLAIKNGLLYIGNGTKWAQVTGGGGGGPFYDSTLMQTVHQTDTAKVNLRNSILLKLNISDSVTKYITARERDSLGHIIDTGRNNIYASLATKVTNVRKGPDSLTLQILVNGVWINAAVLPSGGLSPSNTVKQYLNGFNQYANLNTDSIAEGTTKKFNKLPAGGTAGQVPIKNSSTDYDVSWGPQSGSGGGITGVSPLDSFPKSSTNPLQVNGSHIGGQTADGSNPGFMTALLWREVDSMYRGLLKDTTKGVYVGTGDSLVIFLNNVATQRLFRDSANFHHYKGADGSWVFYSTSGSLSGLSDVTLTSLASGQILQWNGSKWVNISALPTANGGMPSGGTVGQVPIKNSSTNYDYSWGNISGAGVSRSADSLRQKLIDTSGQAAGNVLYYDYQTGTYKFKQSNDKEGALGIVHQQSSWLNLNGYTAGTGFSAVGGKIQVVGSATTFTNSLDRIDTSMLLLHRHFIRFTVNSTPAFQDEILLGINSIPTSAGAKHPMAIGFNIGSNPATRGHIVVYADNTFTAKDSTTTTIPVASGDRIYAWYERNIDTIKATIWDSTQGVIQTTSYAYPMTSAVPAMANIGTFSIWSRGAGTQLIDSQSITTETPQNPQLYILATSKGGYDAGSPTATLAYKLSQRFSTVVNTIGGSNETGQFRSIWPEIRLLRPKNLFLIDFSNDPRDGVSSTVYRGNIIALYDSCKNNGINFIIATPAYEGTGGVNMTSDVNWVNSTFAPSQVIDFNTPTKYNKACIANDSIHWSAFGHDSLFQVTVNSYKIPGLLRTINASAVFSGQTPGAILYSPTSTTVAPSMISQSGTGGNRIISGPAFLTTGNSAVYQVAERSDSVAAWSIYSAAGDLQFLDLKNSATERFRLQAATGNVGIGMTPSNKLDILGNTNGGGMVSILNNNNCTSCFAAVRAGYSTGQYAQLLSYSPTTTANGAWGASQPGLYTFGGDLNILADGTSPGWAIKFLKFGGTEMGRFAVGGNFLLGSSTDNSLAKLQVTGAAYVSDSVLLGNVPVDATSTDSVVTKHYNPTTKKWTLHSIPQSAINGSAPGTPTTGSLGTNISAATIVAGNDGAFTIQLTVSSGSASGTLCIISSGGANFGSSTPHPVFSCHDQNAAVGATQMYMYSSSGNSITVGGTIASPGTYTFEVVVKP